MRGLGVHGSALSVQPPACVGEATADTAVDHLVTNAHDNAAQNGWVDVHLELHITAKIAADRCPQPINLIARERNSGKHYGNQTVTPSRGDYGQLLEPAFEVTVVTLSNRTLDETGRYGPGLPIQQPGHECLLGRHRDSRGAQGQRELRSPVEDSPEPEQLVLDIIEHILTLRLSKQSLDPKFRQRASEVQRSGPASGNRDLQDIESLCRDLLIEQPGRKVGAGRSGYSRIGQRTTDNGLAVEQVHNPVEVVREASEVDRMTGPRRNTWRWDRGQFVQPSPCRHQRTAAGSLHASAPRPGRRRNRRAVRALQTRDEVVDELTLAVVPLQFVTDDLRSEFERDVADFAPDLSNDLGPLRSELRLAAGLDLGDLLASLRTQGLKNLAPLLASVLTNASSLVLRFSELRTVGSEKCLCLLVGLLRVGEPAFDSIRALGIDSLDLGIDPPEEESDEQTERDPTDDQLGKRREEYVLLVVSFFLGDDLECGIHVVSLTLR